jgi:uncharacterized protein
MSVRDTPVVNVEVLPLARAFRNKSSAACGECLRCDLFSVCGGGDLIHRYSRVRGFDAPSVYCEDLMLLIKHVGGYLSVVRPSLRLTE